MSDVARTARLLADSLLPRERRMAPPSRDDVERAMDELRSLVPVDAHDEVAVQEAGEVLMRLRDVAV